MTTHDQVIRNINSLIQRTAPLQGVLGILEETSIRYGLYAGSHMAVLTNNRSPTDVDFLVHDDDIDELKKALPSARTNLDSVVCMFPRLVDGSEVPSDYKVRTLGYRDFFRLSRIARREPRLAAGALGGVHPRPQLGQPPGSRQ
jgi:hypothetical protein